MVTTPPDSLGFTHLLADVIPESAPGLIALDSICGRLARIVAHAIEHDDAFTLAEIESMAPALESLQTNLLDLAPDEDER